MRDVAVTGANGEALFLGYKITFHWFGLPYKLTEDGYVLGVKGSQKYYSLDQPTMASLQAQGRLPSPLPVYEVPAIDRFTANVMWIALALLGLWHGCKIGYWIVRGSLEIPKFELPKLELPKLDLPKRAMPQMAAIRLPKMSGSALAVVELAQARLVHAAMLVEGLVRTSLLRRSPSVNVYAGDIFAPTEVAVHPTKSSAHAAAAFSTRKVAQFPVARVVCREKSLKAA